MHLYSRAYPEPTACSKPLRARVLWLGSFCSEGGLSFCNSAGPRRRVATSDLYSFAFFLHLFSVVLFSFIIGFLWSRLPVFNRLFQEFPACQFLRRRRMLQRGRFEAALGELKGEIF